MIKEDEIFVFGSNIAGRHGKGAALDAVKKYGAIYGVGVGLQGRSYAIPTKGPFMEVRNLPSIKASVDEFLQFARDNPDKKFFVTKIGCGLAGYKEKQIAPFFQGAPDNCRLPEGWAEQ